MIKKTFLLLATVLISLNGAGASGNDRYLLLDSRIIDNTENAELTLGTVKKDPRNPLLMEDKPWEPRRRKMVSHPGRHAVY